MPTAVPTFVDGQVLQAAHLNALRAATAEIAGKVDAPKAGFKKVNQTSSATLLYGIVHQSRYLLVRADTVGGDADYFNVKVNGATVHTDGDPGGALGVAVDLNALGSPPAYNTMYEVAVEIGIGGGNPATAILLHYVLESDTSGQLF